MSPNQLHVQLSMSPSLYFHMKRAPLGSTFPAQPRELQKFLMTPKSARADFLRAFHLLYFRYFTDTLDSPAGTVTQPASAFLKLIEDNVSADHLFSLL